MDYRQRKWRFRGESNSISSKDVTLRLSLIVAIDNHGELYFSLLQANVDHEIFGVFLSKLVQKLSIEDSQWS